MKTLGWKRTRPALAAAVALLTALTFTFVAMAAVLVNDTFQDGNSQNQNLPTSIRIFNGRSGTVRTDAVGSVTFDMTNAGGSEGFWGFFTDGAPVTLDVGDRLTASATFSLQGFQANGQDMRFGLFDSKGTRNTANTTGGLNSPTFTDDTGYAASFFASGTGSPFVVYKRTTLPGATGILNAFTDFTAVPGSGASARQTLQNDTPYTFTFTVERLSATSTQIMISVTGGTLSNLTWTATDSTAPQYNTFDWFGFRINGTSFATRITFTRWFAEYLPAPPLITAQPQPSNLRVQVGSNVQMSVGASGRELSYQWRKNGVPIAGNPTAQTATLQLTNVQESDSGIYDVVVSNAGGSVTSDPVNLTVTTEPVEPPPVITQQPMDTTVTVGSPASLSVVATGNNLAYQWFKNGVLIPGANDATLDFPSAQLSDAGTYYVVVSNSGGSVTSNPARLIVVSPMTVTGLQPPNGATNVCIDTALRITFDRPPLPGTTGVIRVFRADGTLFDSIDMSVDTNPSPLVPGTQSQKQIGGASAAFNYYPIIVTGNTAAIYLHRTLEYNQTYYVTLDPGVITDTGGAPFVGISDPNAWRFTTRAAAPAAGTTMLTVDDDGTGDFCTVQGAIDFVPVNNTQRVVINVRNGTYTEIVYIRSSKPFITVRGESRDQTVVQYANNENLNTGSLPRSLFGVDAPDFTLENITLHNTTSRLNAENRTRQSEAFRGNNQRILLNRVNLKSFQDTLQLSGTGFVNDSYIEGDIDFTWGYGSVYFRNCELRAVSNTTYYTQIRNGASVERPTANNRGNVYVNCRLTRAPGVSDATAYLSRIDPDSYPNSEVVFIDTAMDRHIRPEGWRFDNPDLPTTPENYPNIHFWEYHTTDLMTGAPVDCSQRHPISRNDCNRPLTPEEVAFYRNPANILNGWTPQIIGTGQLLISEFRFSGPGGAGDEYVELYNNTDTAVDLSGLWVHWLQFGGASYRSQAIPNGTVVPPRGHYLLAHVNYSLAAYAPADQSFDGGVPTSENGVGLFAFNSPDASARLDAVIFSDVPTTAPYYAAFYEGGTPLPPTGESTTEHAWVRDPLGGTPKDTNNNAADFVLVSTTAASIGGVQSRLGAPGPENLSSPVQSKGALKVGLVDPGCTSTSNDPATGCPRVRLFVPDPTEPTNSTQGTLKIRRKFTNNTNAPVTRLRFRVIDITTLNSPGYTPGGGQADLRVLNSPDSVVTLSGGGVAQLNGTTREQPPAQPNGGGLNTSLTVALPGGQLAPGESVNVEFNLGVMQGGSFRYIVNMEVLPATTGATSSAKLSASKLATARQP